MTDNPLVTFLMSVHNGERWLNESLSSISIQTYPNLEIILIDNGSTDKTSGILSEFAESDSRVCVYSKDNSGLTDSLNYGMVRAKGEWIARLDHDDFCTLDRVEKQIRLSAMNSDLVLIGSSFKRLNAKTSSSQFVKVPKTHGQLVKRLETMRGFFPHSSAMFKTNSALQLGGYRASAILNQDWDLWLRLAEHGEIASCKEPLVTIRVHDSQMSANHLDQRPTAEAFLSSTAHFIRIFGGIDPTDVPDSKHCQDFRKFVFKSLEESQELKFIEIQQKCRVVLNSQLPLILKIFKSFIVLIQSKYLFRIMKHQIFGSESPKLIAQDYLKELDNL